MNDEELEKLVRELEKEGFPDNEIKEIVMLVRHIYSIT